MIPTQNIVHTTKLPKKLQSLPFWLEASSSTPLYLCSRMVDVLPVPLNWVVKPTWLAHWSLIKSYDLSSLHHLPLG